MALQQGKSSNGGAEISWIPAGSPDGKAKQTRNEAARVGRVLPADRALSSGHSSVWSRLSCERRWAACGRRASAAWLATTRPLFLPCIQTRGCCLETWGILRWSSAIAIWTVRASGRPSSVMKWSWRGPANSSKSWSKMATVWSMRSRVSMPRSSWEIPSPLVSLAVMYVSVCGWNRVGRFDWGRSASMGPRRACRISVDVRERHCQGGAAEPPRENATKYPQWWDDAGAHTSCLLRAPYAPSPLMLVAAWDQFAHRTQNGWWMCSFGSVWHLFGGSLSNS